MADLILTGASRGIGRALALSLANRPDRLLLVARDRPGLEALAREIEAKGGRALPVPGDLSTLAGASALGAELLRLAGPGATLVHNAGLWPYRRTLTADGLEQAFATNHLGPLAMQAPLLDAARLRRILVVGAGLMGKGRFDPERTPSGADFSALRTYATTKLCFAMAMRDVASAHPAVDVLVLHPGVVRTDLGARPGPIGWLVDWVKRGWEAPERCAARLARILGRDRWSPPGEAKWWVIEEEQPWPAPADDRATRETLRRVTERLLAGRRAA